MKAKAMFLTMCILLVAVAGFGQTTSDLSRNSTPDMIHQDQSVSVVNQLPEFKQVFIIQTDLGTMEVLNYTDGNCHLVCFGEIKTEADLTGTPFFARSLSDERNYRKTPDPNCIDPNAILNRNARDGLSYNALSTL